MGLVSLGSAINKLNWFKKDYVEVADKVQRFHAVGVALVTTTPATQIAVNVLSRQLDVANLPLILPVGAVVTYVGIRTEQALICATGEVIKPAALHTETSPILTAAANAIAPGAAKNTVAAAALGAAKQIFLLNSNAGNTAAGTGVSCSATAKSAYTNAGVVPVIVEICYTLSADPATAEDAYKAG